ncbi:MAG: hypothetical protein ACK2VA_18290 [Anaerolineae bacterium]
MSEKSVYDASVAVRADDAPGAVQASLLPTVAFCGLTVTRLIIGANPFGGYSHQNAARDEEMRTYYTVGRILETWERAEAAGINTMITNNETPHVLEAVRRYLGAGGTLQWIAQLNCRTKPDMRAAIDEAVAIGCKAVYFHGALVDKAYVEQDEGTIRAWCDHARSRGVPAGVAGHAPQAHLWVHGLDAADFHAVCLFNCGSLHTGKGDKFRLADMAPALAAIRRIEKPCIAYKIMGAGRIDARMAFEYAFEQIKPGDVVNVGMHRGDRDDMVGGNAVLVREILSA